MTELGKFDAVWLAEFRKKSGITDEAALAALQTELQRLGQHYRRIIETTPCDLKGSPFNRTLTQRGNWLQKQVISPAEKLLAALADGQQAMFSTWPYEHEFEAFPDRAQMRKDLENLLKFAERLHRNLRGEQAADAATNHELRYYIFKDAYVAVRRHLPGLKPTQSKFAALESEKTKRYVDPFAEAMRHIYAHITGIDDQLVRLIRMVIQDPDFDY